MIARDECANPTRSSYADVGIAVWVCASAPILCHTYTMLGKMQSRSQHAWPDWDAVED